MVSSLAWLHDTSICYGHSLAPKITRVCPDEGIELEMWPAGGLASGVPLPFLSNVRSRSMLQVLGRLTRRLKLPKLKTGALAPMFLF